MGHSVLLWGMLFYLGGKSYFDGNFWHLLTCKRADVLCPILSGAFIDHKLFLH